MSIYDRGFLLLAYHLGGSYNKEDVGVYIEVPFCKETSTCGDPRLSPPITRARKLKHFFRDPKKEA